MKKALFIGLLFIGLYGHGQNVYTATPSPNPVECSSFSVSISGDMPATNYLITGETVSVNGNVLTIVLNFDAPGFGLTIITPYTHSVTVPANTTTSGAYTLDVQCFFTPFGQTTSGITQPLAIGSCCPASPSFTTNATDYCWDDNVLITDLSAGATSVDWYVNNVLDHSGAGDFSLSGLSGSVTIKQVVSDGACSDSTETTINVSAMPSNGFNVIQSGTQYTFTATGSSAFTYNWDFGDGSTATGALVNHTYSADGVYNACLTSTNSDSCMADSCTTITFSTIGLEDEQESSIRIYPNPANQIIQLEGTFDSDIRWFNQLGQEFELAPNQASNEFLRVYDVSALPAGTYYIQWSDKAQRILINH